MNTHVLSALCLKRWKGAQGTEMRMDKPRVLFAYSLFGKQMPT